jgi:glycosyltransferase involved in cell wall biosynthesis
MRNGAPKIMTKFKDKPYSYELLPEYANGSKKFPTVKSMNWEGKSATAKVIRGFTESTPVVQRCPNPRSISRLVIVPKLSPGQAKDDPDHGFRVCVNALINKCIKPDASTIPLAVDEIKKLAHCKYFLQLDGANAYWSIPVCEESMRLTAFHTPDGIFCWNRLLMGAKPSSAVQQSAYLEALDDYIDFYEDGTLRKCLMDSEGNRLKDAEGNITTKWFALTGKLAKGVKAERALFKADMIEAGYPVSTVDVYWQRVKESDGYVTAGNSVKGQDTIDSKTFAPGSVRAIGGGEATRKLVYAGSYMPYKGVETIVQALKYLPGFDLQLISSANREVQKRLNQIAGDSASHLHFLGGLDDAEYAQALGQATAFVSASTDEGFGIPLIEAMACGTAVVCSDIPVFREVTGGCAEFFEPSNPKSLAEAVNRLTSERLPARIDSGIARSAQFSWDGSARVLSQLIDDLGQKA